MQNQEYNSRFGISQSAIKDFKFKSPKKWKEIWIDKQLDISKKEENFILGSLIDTILFSPSELNERYFIADAPKLPSVALQKIVENIYNAIHKDNKFTEENQGHLPNVEYKKYDLSDKEMLLHYMDTYEEVDKDGNRKIGWNKTWKADTRVENLQKNGQEYFDSIIQAQGRKVISAEMNMNAIELKKVLHNDEDVKGYFVADETNELIFQLEIFIDFILSDGSKIPLKGALDILRINHGDKTVQIADFKSSYSAFDFIKSIKQFGYADQLSYYDFLLREWLATYCDGQYCEYTILPPCNVVIDVKEKIPYIYEYSWHDLVIARHGNRDFLFSLFQTHDHNQKLKKGWQEILEEIGWHYGQNLWEKPKELYEHKKIKVNLASS